MIENEKARGKLIWKYRIEHSEHWLILTVTRNGGNDDIQIDSQFGTPGRVDKQFLVYTRRQEISQLRDEQ